MSARAILSHAIRQLRPLSVQYAPRRTIYSTTIRAMSGEGQINSDLIKSMETKISEALQAQKVEVADIQGDGRHVEIVVISKEFEGKSAVNRQRMVYKAIWEELQETVHAVDAMVTQTPEEAGV